MNNIQISYDKLYNLVTHQITLYTETLEKIEQNTAYYVLQEPQALKDYKMLCDKIEEWEWLKEILEESIEIIT